MNENVVRLVKLYGDFVWHAHPETDEVFILLARKLDIELSDQTLHMLHG